MLIRLIGLFEVIVLLTPVSAAFSADQAAPAAPEVLARGPIHEAYAEPVEQSPVGGAIVPKEPPQQIEEMPPEQKPAGDHVVWLPGYWSYDEDRKDYIWISGFWRAMPPGKVWMPGSWRKVDAGWQWAGGMWGNAQEQHEVQYLPQPPAPAEVAATTPAPTATAIYVPGCWVWKDHYVWRTGYWIEQKPNWIWIPAHYRWTPAGYVYIDGYWDYALADRGILYAPAYIPSTVYLQASFRYSPTIVVREQCVMGALFVRRGYGCYYFGDYYDPGYATMGYVSWCGYSPGPQVVVVRGWYDPMYSYYRVSYRDDPVWHRDMINLYVGRYRGEIAPPPRTLVAQNAVIVQANINVGNVQMLTTVNLMARANPALRFDTLTVAQRQEHFVAAREVIEVGARRNQMEMQLAVRNGGIPRNAPSTLKVEMAHTMVRATMAREAAAAKAEAKTGAPGAHPLPTKQPPPKKLPEKEKDHERKP